MEDGAFSSSDVRVGVRLEDEVYARLLSAIHSGDFVLGQKLPTEHVLAQQFGVSRPVVRNALSRLRDHGLIVSRRGAGSFVTSGTAGDGHGYRPLQSVEDIAHYFRFRRMIEGEAAALAAPRVRPRDIAELRRCIDDMATLIESGTATIEPDLKFHTMIANLSGNRFLVEAIAMLRPQMVFIGKFVRSLASTGYTHGKRQMGSEHEAIVAALETGDADASREAMTRHIDASQNRVFKGEEWR